MKAPKEVLEAMYTELLHSVEDEKDSMQAAYAVAAEHATKGMVTLERAQEAIEKELVTVERRYSSTAHVISKNIIRRISPLPKPWSERVTINDLVPPCEAGLGVYVDGIQNGPRFIRRIDAERYCTGLIAEKEAEEKK